MVQVTCSTAPASAQTATQVSLGSDVSSTLSATIKQVATGFGTGAIGGWVPIALPDDTSDVLLVAVDGTGSPVLAAMATGSTTILDGNSTALALVRILLALSSSVTTAQENAAIQGASGWSNFVSLVEADIAANVAPLSDSKVQSALVAVALAAGTSLQAASNGAAASRSTARAKDALGTPTMTQLGEFPVIPSADPNNPYFYITALPSAQNVTAHNAMALPWTVQTFTANANGTSAPLGSKPILAQTLLSGQRIAILPMTNSPFNFVLTQDQAALNQIAKDFGESLIEGAVALSLTLDKEVTCAPQLAGAIATALGKLSIADGTTFEATEDALLGAVDPIAGPIIVSECAGSNSVALSVLYTAIKQTFLKTLAEGLGYVSIASSANQIFQEAWYANQQWNKTYTVGVCAAQDYSINSCVASFQFYPTQLLMMPGATASVTMQGLDATQHGTLLPGDLTITPTAPAVASVTGTAPFTVTANTIGQTQIDVLDPATGANNYQTPAQGAQPFLVTVTQPTLAPSSNTLVIGGTDQTFTVSLQGPAGEAPCTAALLEPCLSVPNNINWNAVNNGTSVTAVTTTDPVGTWTLPANSTPGTVSITGTAGGVTYGPITILVTAPAATVTLGTVTWVADNTGNPETTPYECCNYLLFNVPFTTQGVSVAPDASNTSWNLTVTFPNPGNPNAYVHFYGTGDATPAAPYRTDGGTNPNFGNLGWGVSVHTGGQYTGVPEPYATFTVSLNVVTTDPTTGASTTTTSNVETVQVPLVLCQPEVCP
jgi:hypothetical protein